MEGLRDNGRAAHTERGRRGEGNGSNPRERGQDATSIPVSIGGEGGETCKQQAHTGKEGRTISGNGAGPTTGDINNGLSEHRNIAGTHRRGHEGGGHIIHSAEGHP